MIRAALVALALLPCQLAAEPAAIRPADLERLARFDEAAGDALLQALRDGSAEDLAALRDALDKRPVAPAPAGDWTCRTMKAGGAVALAVYSPFRCRITRISPTEWEFEKLTGSQRSTGTIAFHEGRAIYRGVGYVGDTPASAYADLPEPQDPVAPNQTHPQIAVFEQVSDSEARLMFPYPILESTFDILHLTR